MGQLATSLRNAPRGISLQCDAQEKEKLKELLNKREPNYKKAHYTIDANNSLEQIIKDIKGNL